MSNTVKEIAGGKNTRFLNSEKSRDIIALSI